MSTLPILPAIEALTRASSVPSEQAIDRLKFFSPAASNTTAKRGIITIPEQLFDNAANLKISLSQVVRYLQPGWRERIFKQLDKLLCFDNWDEDDSAFINQLTYMTMLRFIVYSQPNRMPLLGVGPTGHILAAWINGEYRLSVEFLVNDQANANFMTNGDRGKAFIAWHGHVAELYAFANKNSVAKCFEIDE